MEGHVVINGLEMVTSSGRGPGEGRRVGWDEGHVSTQTGGSRRLDPKGHSSTPLLAFVKEEV